MFKRNHIFKNRIWRVRAFAIHVNNQYTYRSNSMIYRIALTKKTTNIDISERVCEQCSY